MAYYIIKLRDGGYWDGHGWNATAEDAKAYNNDELPDSLPANGETCKRSDLRWRNRNREIIAEAFETLISVLPRRGRENERKHHHCPSLRETRDQES